MAQDKLNCKAIAPGVEKGRLNLSDQHMPKKGPDCPPPRELADEIDRFQENLEKVCDDIQKDIEHLDEQKKFSEAGILRAHVSILKDQMFQERVHEFIHQCQNKAEDAVEHVTEEMASLFDKSDDPVFSQRGADFRDLANRLKDRMLPYNQKLQAADGDVVALPELFPSQVIKASRQGVRAFIIETGTPFAHSAILAKSFQIPVVLVDTLTVLKGRDGAFTLVDATNEHLLIEPSEDELAGLADSPAYVPVPKENLPVRLWLNITDPAQLRGINWKGIEGVGMYRTEMPFIQKQHNFPTEKEQRDIYKELFSLCGHQPVTVRLVEVGGDKPLEHMTMGPEENPQLGLRGPRLYHYHPEIMTTQLRAVLRAGSSLTDLRIMLPFTESVEVLDFMIRLRDQALESLWKEGVDFCEQFQTGILIETPAAVRSAGKLLASADFCCVGTNDLVQYLFAVDRNNPNVEFMYQPHHPIILRVLRELLEKAQKAGKTLTICGEIAGDPRIIPLLVGLGIEDISVNVGALQKIMPLLTELDVEECINMSETALEAETAEEVGEMLDQRHGTVDRKQVDHSGFIDPVCKMRVDAEEAPFNQKVGNRRYYFCSRHCRDIFVRTLQ